jgi:hypothetical protein
VIDPALGELEFEAEENELTLSVSDINGEWAVFVPAAAGEAGAGAGEGAAEEGEGTELEVEVVGQFDSLVAVQGGDLKQDILFPQGVSRPVLTQSVQAPYRSAGN